MTRISSTSLYPASLPDWTASARRLAIQSALLPDFAYLTWLTLTRISVLPTVLACLLVKVSKAQVVIVLISTPMISPYNKK